MSSNCWALMMVSSSEKTFDVTTSLDNCGTKDLRNHSSRNVGGTSTLIKLFRHLHSRMWSEIWSVVVCSKLASNSMSVSYLTGNWKWFRKAIANSPKEEYLEQFSYMYHLLALLMSVCWNNCNCTESYFNELDKHQRWKVVTWSPGYSLGLASNFGMSEGNFISIGGQRGLWQMGSFNNLVKSRKCKLAKKGIFGHCWW